MASNPAAPFGVEFRHVEDLHSGPPPFAGATAQAATRRPNGPRSAFSLAGMLGKGAADGPGESPFASLSARHGRPLRVAILSDFTRIPYANGAAFQTRFLYQELRRCGHEVTVIGPR